jgi:YidC/Oxa1 family membrane protein insertase
MDRRASLAFFLFMMVLMAWVMLKQVNRPPLPATPPANVTPASAPDASGNPATAATDRSVAAQPAPAAAPLAFPATKDVPLDENIVVDTDLFRVRLTNRGAGIRELKLKRHFTTTGIAGDPARERDPANWLTLCTDLDPEWPALQLRRNPGTPGSGLPLESSNWSCETKPLDGGTDLLFRFEDGAGDRIEKLLRFRDGRYDVGVELRFASDRDGPAQGTASFLLTAVANIVETHRTRFTEKPSIVVTVADDDELTVIPADKLKDGPKSEPVVRGGLMPFVGATNNYFAFALRPDAETRQLLETATATRVFDRPNFEAALRDKEKEDGHPLDAAGQQSLRDDWNSNVRAEAMLRVPLKAKGADPVVLRFDLFAGMRSPEVMERPEYTDFRILYSIQYGRSSLRWINRILLIWMGLMHSLTHNWGVAIILLTVTVKALLFPLNRMQSRTMETFQKKMKLLQPEIDEIKQRYKNNLQKTQQEQQKLMAKHGVRPPIFGCLILFLQMPVWYGLFQIMRTAPELRQSPFFGWISDLSAPDIVPLPFHLPFLGSSLHLLPILMVIAWLVQNRMMPKATDPQQAQMQKMMNFFPFVFGFMLYSYASGQSLYMLVNSILGMLQMKFLRVTPTS